MLLNTRPDDLAAALGDELKALGVESVHLPLLSIERLSVAPEIALAKNYRLVLCVSPRAAEFFLASLSQSQLQVFSQQVLIAVGARTAQVLSEAGLSAGVPEQISSEGLLAMPEFGALQAGDSLMILRGQGGRRLIDEVMSASGVTVDELILYKRCEPENLEARYKNLKKTDLTQVLITSFESWQRFVQIESNLTQYRYLLLGERLLKLIAPDLGAAAAKNSSQPDSKSESRPDMKCKSQPDLQCESQPDLKCESQPAATFDPKSLCHVLTDLSPTTIAKAYLTWT